MFPISKEREVTSIPKKRKTQVTTEASKSKVDAEEVQVVASTSAYAKKPVNIKQTAKIFELSIEVFMEILAYFPAVPIPTRVKAPLLHPSSMQRTDVLRALSQTCQSFRDIFFDMLWQRVDVCTVKSSFATGKRHRYYGEKPKGAWYLEVSNLLLRISEGLLTNPSHASHVQTMNLVISRCNHKALLGALVRCLETLPNLHTFQIYHTHTQMTTYFKDAFEGHCLPQIRTIILPTYAHNVLRCCPNVTTVFCNVGDGSQLVSAIRKVCKKIEVMDGFPLLETNVVKRIPKSAPTLRVLRMHGKATPEMRTILSAIKDLKIEEIKPIREFNSYGRLVEEITVGV